MFSRPKTTRTC